MPSRRTPTSLFLDAAVCCPAVDLAEEAAAICARELFYKASLVEAAGAPAPDGMIKEQARENLACWVARPFLEPQRLETIRRTFRAEAAD